MFTVLISRMRNCSEVRLPKQMSFRRNTSKDGEDVMSSGRVFQSLGPATANERSLLLSMLSKKNVTANYVEFLLGHIKFLCP